MKRLRVQVIGSGKATDAFRIALPSYSLVDIDYATMTAIVDVTDDTYPPAPNGKPETVTQDVKFGAVITAVDAAHVAAASAFYDDKYREHVGQFTLGVK